jgi:hypothetical protein
VGEKSSYDNTNANIEGVNGLTIEDIAYDENMVTYWPLNPLSKQSKL